MSAPEAIRRELFGAVADLPPGELRGWLLGYLDGIEDRMDGGAPDVANPRRELLRDTAREWLAELEGGDE